MFVYYLCSFQILLHGSIGSITLAQLLCLSYFGSKSEYTMAPKIRGGIRQRHDRRIREALAAGRPEEEAEDAQLGDVPDLMENDSEEGGTGPTAARKKRRQGEKEERGSAEGDKEKEEAAKDYKDCIATNTY